jgi:hypothetical protein
MANNKKIKVQGIDVVMYEDGKEDFISLTDIARHQDSVRSDYILQNWLRNRSTIEFIGLWEQFHNPKFNSIEFDGIKNVAGSNSFSLMPKGGLRKRTLSELFPKRGDTEVRMLIPI